MTVTAGLAYVLIASYFVLERSLRKGEKARSLETKTADAGSSKLLLVDGAVGLLLAIAAPYLNAYHLGAWQNPLIGWMGVFVMLSGLALRYWAAKTLGEFYTRTLQITDGQKLVDATPYNLIRHPGYLGTLLLNAGAGLALMNAISFYVAGMAGLLSKMYRIHAEDKMLAAEFGESFEQYSGKTWRLIPYLY